MIVLGLDISLSSSGIALVDVGALRLVWSETIKTKAHNAKINRLHAIYRAAVRHSMLSLTHGCAAIAMESGVAYGSGRGNSALVVAEARGGALLGVRKSGLPVTMLAPSDWKKHVVGNGNADKDEVVAAVERILGVCLPSDEADAAAVALAAGGYSVPATTKPRTPRERAAKKEAK